MTRLWGEIQVPRPHRARWRQQLVSVYLQQAHLFARHPGLERAYFGTAPATPKFLDFVGAVLAAVRRRRFSARVRELEPVLEAMAVSWASSRRCSTTSRESPRLSTGGTPGILDRRRWTPALPHLVDTDFHSYPTRASRAAAFEKVWSSSSGFEAV